MRDRSLRWRGGTSDPLTLTLPASFTLGEINLEVGGRYAGNNSKEWAIRYDDIEIYED